MGARSRRAVYSHRCLSCGTGAGRVLWGVKQYGQNPAKSAGTSRNISEDAS